MIEIGRDRARDRDRNRKEIATIVLITGSYNLKVVSCFWISIYT